MALQIECYRNQNVEESEVNKLATEEKNKRRELCLPLGLNKQGEVLESDDTASKFYPRLSWFDLMIWMLFLPTGYSKKYGQWGNYYFDVVPVKILEEMTFAESLGIFNDLEIRTSERGVDPILLGIVGIGQGVQYYLISRWGESLRPFSEIKAEVLKSMFKNHLGVPIPEKVREFVDDLQQRNPMRGVSVLCRTVFIRHCRSRMFIVNQYTPVGNDDHYHVCGICGFGEKKDCNGEHLRS